MLKRNSIELFPFLFPIFLSSQTGVGALPIRLHKHLVHFQVKQVPLCITAYWLVWSPLDSDLFRQELVSNWSWYSSFSTQCLKQNWYSINIYYMDGRVYTFLFWVSYPVMARIYIKWLAYVLMMFISVFSLLKDMFLKCISKELRTIFQVI